MSVASLVNEVGLPLSARNAARIGSFVYRRALRWHRRAGRSPARPPGPCSCTERTNAGRRYHVRHAEQRPGLVAPGLCCVGSAATLDIAHL